MKPYFYLLVCGIFLTSCATKTLVPTSQNISFEDERYVDVLRTDKLEAKLGFEYIWNDFYVFSLVTTNISKDTLEINPQDFYATIGNDYTQRQAFYPDEVLFHIENEIEESNTVSDGAAILAVALTVLDVVVAISGADDDSDFYDDSGNSEDDLEDTIELYEYRDYCRDFIYEHIELLPSVEYFGLIFFPRNENKLPQNIIIEYAKDQRFESHFTLENLNNLR